MGEKVASMYVEVSSDTTKLQKGLADTKTGMQQASAGASSLIKSFLPLATVGGAAALGFKALKDSINETVAYNKQIREISQFTGMAVDETARLVQVADDWGVSADAVRTSMQMMTKNGMVPSIDNLAKLADEFVNTSDKAAFAEKATKLLGRQWTTLVPLLAEGGAALKEHAASISSALIPTEEMIKRTREWEVATDNLDDTLTGLKYTLGEGVIPPLTRMLNLMNDTITRQSIMNDAVREGIVTREQMSAVNLREAQTGQVDLKFWKELADRLYTIHDAVSSTTHVWPGFRGQLKSTTRDAEDLSQAMANLKQLIAGDVGKANKDFINQQKDMAGQAADLRKQITELGGTEYYTPQQTAQIDKLQGSLNHVLGNINLVKDAIDIGLGPRKEIKAKKSLEEMEKQAGSLEAKIRRLGGVPYSTPDQRKQLEETRLKLKEVEAQIKLNEDAHAKASKQMMWDLLDQQAAIGGYSDVERETLTDLAYSWGLVDANTYLSTEAAKAFWANVEKGVPPTQAQIDALIATMGGVSGELQTWQMGVDTFGAALAGLPKNIQIDIWVKTHSPTIAPGSIPIPEGAPTTNPNWNQPKKKVPVVTPPKKKKKPEKKSALGLDMIVPPGYSEDDYLVGVNSGEHIQVIPPGKMGGGGGDTYNSYNITNLNPKAAAINTAMLLNGRRQRLNASMGG